jgi:3-oxoadipate enol-lactonase
MKKPTLHWIKEGQGPVVVLSHALGCDLRMWDSVAAILQVRFTVLRYDQRGHGQSEVVPGPYTMGLLAEDAAELIREQTPGAVHFVGLSMGGMVAQSLAASQPQLLKSIVIASAANHYNEAARDQWQARINAVRTQGVSAIAEGAMQRWFTPEFRADQAGAARVDSLRQQLENTDAAAYAASCGAVAGMDFRASNAHIACPALVIAGTRDEATPVALSQAIVDSIAGSQLRTLEAAHLSAVEQPEAFARLLEVFFDSVESKPKQ